MDCWKGLALDDINLAFRYVAAETSLATAIERDLDRADVVQLLIAAVGRRRIRYACDLN
jgi:hypothetical protein